MRFLANENFPLDAIEALRQNGHDVVWIRVESPGISDSEVLSRAQALTVRKSYSWHRCETALGRKPFGSDCF